MTTDLDDQAAYEAARRVALCRRRLDAVRRRFMRRQAGSTDVAKPEAELSAALDQPDRVGGLRSW